MTEDRRQTPLDMLVQEIAETAGITEQEGLIVAQAVVLPLIRDVIQELALVTGCDERGDELVMTDGRKLQSRRRGGRQANILSVELSPELVWSIYQFQRKMEELAS